MKKQELAELKVSIWDRLRKAIGDGDTKMALALVDEMDANRKFYRDFYLSWVDLLLSYVAEKQGETAVYDSLVVLHEKLVAPTIESAVAVSDCNERLRKRAYIWTSIHGATIDDIVEDSEKFTIKMSCASGGTIMTKLRFGKTQKAYPWSYGRTGLAYYCAHCAVSPEILSMKEFGFPAWLSFPQPEGKCIQIVYKDLERVPEEYYKRVGLKKRPESPANKEGIADEPTA